MKEEKTLTRQTHAHKQTVDCCMYRSQPYDKDAVSKQYSFSKYLPHVYSESLKYYTLLHYKHAQPRRSTLPSALCYNIHPLNTFRQWPKTYLFEARYQHHVDHTD